MKSYEEMTNAVLLRANMQKEAQKRRHRNRIAVIACVCFLGLAVWAGALLKQSSTGGEIRDSRISVFCVTANASSQQQMLKGEKVPYYAVVSIRNIEGVGADELEQMRIADKEYARQLVDLPLEDPTLTWSMTVRTTETTMVSTVFAGNFFLTFSDYEQVRDVSVTTTEIGYTSLHGVDYYAQTEKDGIGITWALSEAGVDMIEKNPDMKLSELNDTITVTVEFNDGSTETAVIAITVDDDGQIYGTFRGSGKE